MNKFITSEFQIKVTANKNLFQYCTYMYINNWTFVYIVDIDILDYI